MHLELSSLAFYALGVNSIAPTRTWCISLPPEVLSLSNVGSPDRADEGESELQSCVSPGGGIPE